MTNDMVYNPPPPVKFFRISVDQIMSLDYLAAPAPSRRYFGGSRAEDPRDVLREVCS